MKLALGICNVGLENQARSNRGSNTRKLSYGSATEISELINEV